MFHNIFSNYSAKTECNNGIISMFCTLLRKMCSSVQNQINNGKKRVILYRKIASPGRCYIESGYG